MPNSSPAMVSPNGAIGLYLASQSNTGWLLPAMFSHQPQDPSEIQGTNGEEKVVDKNFIECTTI